MSRTCNQEGTDLLSPDRRVSARIQCCRLPRHGLVLPISECLYQCTDTSSFIVLTSLSQSDVQIADCTYMTQYHWTRFLRSEMSHSTECTGRQGQRIPALSFNPFLCMWHISTHGSHRQTYLAILPTVHASVSILELFDSSPCGPAVGTIPASYLEIIVECVLIILLHAMKDQMRRRAVLASACKSTKTAMFAITMANRTIYSQLASMNRHRLIQKFAALRSQNEQPSRLQKLRNAPTICVVSENWLAIFMRKPIRRTRNRMMAKLNTDQLRPSYRSRTTHPSSSKGYL